jgi:hypothetical protein
VAEAKQSNDFLGTNNNFLSGKSKTVSVTSDIATCAFKLAFRSQPADAAQSASDASKSDPVTTVAGSPTGAPVEVVALDAGDNPVPVDATVSVASTGTPGAFSGTFAMTNGVVSLSPVVISSTTSPLGTYRLVASSSAATLGGATSEPFDVVSRICSHEGTSTDECEASLSVTGNGNGTLVYRARAVDLDNSASNTGSTSISVTALASAAPAACGTFQQLGPGALIDVRPLAGKLYLTIEISKLDRQYLANNGLALLKVCIGSNLPFRTITGAPSTRVGDEFVGVLPNCPATTSVSYVLEDGKKVYSNSGTLSETVSSPCVLSRSSVRGGATLVVELPNVGILGPNGLPGYDPKAYLAP